MRQILREQPFKDDRMRVVFLKLQVSLRNTLTTQVITAKTLFVCEEFVVFRMTRSRTLVLYPQQPGHDCRQRLCVLLRYKHRGDQSGQDAGGAVHFGLTVLRKKTIKHNERAGCVLTTNGPSFSSTWSLRRSLSQPEILRRDQHGWLFTAFHQDDHFCTDGFVQRRNTTGSATQRTLSTEIVKDIRDVHATTVFLIPLF